MVTLRRLTITQGLYFLVGIGLAANTFLLLFHIFILCLGHRPKQIDLVRCHLALVHVIMLLTLLFLMCPDLYESLGFQDDFKCKAFVFTNRVMRGLVICTTCLLTVLQALTLSHSNSWLARFKQRTPTATIFSIFLFWVINLSVCIDLIIYTVSSNGTKSNFPTISKFCTFSPKISSDLLFLVTISRDTTVVGVMLLSSAYMVMLLLRHQKRSQHLTTSLSLRVSMEKRATLIILVLVSFFVVTCWTDCIISFYLLMLWVFHPLIMVVQRFAVSFYAIVSPLVLIISDRRITAMMKNMRHRCTF